MKHDSDEMWQRLAREALQRSAALMTRPGVTPAEAAMAREAALRRCVDLLNQDRGVRHQDYLRQAPLRAAYLSAYLLPNARRVADLLEREVDGQATWRSVLDIGAGPLSASLGVLLSRHGRHLRQVYAVDRSAEILQDGLAIAAALFPQVALRHVAGSALGRQACLPRERFDLVVLANVLAEIRGRRDEVIARARRLLDAALDRCQPDGVVLLLEPGTRVAATVIMTLRDQLGDAASILAPCPGVTRCPLRRSTSWCHTTHPVRLPEEIVGLRRAVGLQSRTLGYSYLLLSPRPQPPRARARVLSDVMPRGNRLVRTLCTPRGLRTVEWSATEPSGELARAHRGAAVALPAAPDASRSREIRRRRAAPRR